jgi:DNA-binding NarL/FixJ family response regulator
VSPGELERAVREVAVGGSVVDSKIIEVLVESRSRRGSAVDALTPRERDVGLIAEGLNNTSIVEELVLMWLAQ